MSREKKVNAQKVSIYAKLDVQDKILSPMKTRLESSERHRQNTSPLQQEDTLMISSQNENL